MPSRKELEDLGKEELINLLEDGAKNWLAHDGLWFQAVEGRFGMETAMEMDSKAWEKFTVVEAERIKKRLHLPPQGGLEALEKALQFRLYARINEQKTRWVNAHTLCFEMVKCRVQEARKRKNLPDFPCKPVGLVEYEGFARTIDPRIQTRCITCPPDPSTKDCFCKWEFLCKE